MKDRGHGGDLYGYRLRRGESTQEVLDFSANINPLGVAPGVKRAMVDALEAVDNYPDPQCRALKHAISDFERVAMRSIVCGNGAADIIFRLVYAVQPTKALILAPTFSEYEEALEVVGCEVCYHTMQEEVDFQVTASILDQIDPSVSVVFICNPNNPTGQVTNTQLMEAILSKCTETKTLLVVDECFNDFLDEPERYTMKERLSESGYLFILKAFTKMYAIPGVRLGYGLTTNMTLLEAIESAGQAWSVSTIAQAAGCAAVDEQAYVAQTKKLIADERQYLQEALIAIGMKVYPAYANYIFFKSPYQIDLRDRLEEKGILIRSCSNYKGLDHQFYRIGIKTHRANARFIQVLRDSIEIKHQASKQTI